ncbi:SGNH/GDSL hydrolase family protein [Agrobacterium rubi]|uniref:SGNH/GDSL hydrolase family protein n=1 Tax=Agrobacterium rubi TaxID=28099 RepID=A0AAE7UP88_9HYPH|nr:SGNH/GDSL hydrolase family protein [Agrobacterium rubi]NTE86416.1 SGNH/GDSL hydrolase family protein [Agrobacterium rubi]NTF02348.1 SGNH/GDSL hydrolase family protein [Agrobacterium rubi]NTF36592.1 SGNH/GDSL hydrolase family protein [Agrobacterium rubi]OCJ55761.1 arylesterase [Agrobacterium rubi]QTF99051.1 SGNH/GDSL hydrolase family protein [Agrobacterium rubi]
MTKTVLCYGDSLTWGFDAENLGRHAFENRWPSVLQKALGTDVNVIAEGLNGRTTAYDDHLADCDRNGARILPTLLHSHAPLDLVIIMLGTNDLKRGIGSGNAVGAVKGVERLINLVRSHVWSFDDEQPEILIVSAPHICETGNEMFAAMFIDAVEESQMMGSLYRDLADEKGCGFFDAASVAVTTPVDGVHLDAENTRAIGRGLEPVVRMMLGL